MQVCLQLAEWQSPHDWSTLSQSHCLPSHFSIRDGFFDFYSSLICTLFFFQSILISILFKYDYASALVVITVWGVSPSPAPPFCSEAQKIYQQKNISTNIDQQCCLTSASRDRALVQEIARKLSESGGLGCPRALQWHVFLFLTLFVQLGDEHSCVVHNLEVNTTFVFESFRRIELSCSQSGKYTSVC